MNLQLFKSREALDRFLERNYATRTNKEKSIQFAIRWRPCLSDSSRDRWSYCAKATEPDLDYYAEKNRAENYHDWTINCDMFGFAPEELVWMRPEGSHLKVVK